MTTCKLHIMHEQQSIDKVIAKGNESRVQEKALYCLYYY